MPRAVKPVATKPAATKPAASKSVASPKATPSGRAKQAVSTAPPAAASSTPPKRTSGAKTTTSSAKAHVPVATTTPTAKRAVKKPVADVPVADKFLQEQHALLLSERATYVQQAESLRAEAEQLAAEMEPGDSQFDEESGEGDTMNVERERDLALSAQARAAVDEIDRALAKIDAGTYGICERCGEPIKKARLKALPYAALCIECKSGGLSRR